ncbi:MAG: MerR family transcriptional regulator [Ignavibacteriales bacterium]
MQVSIGEAGRLSGLTPRAIRLYEDRGLLTAGRDQNGVRLYGAEGLDRLGFIALARHAGLAIRDIARLLKIGDAQGLAEQNARMVDLCHKRLNELEAERQKVRGVLSQLDARRSQAA